MNVKCLLSIFQKTTETNEAHTPTPQRNQNTQNYFQNKKYKFWQLLQLFLKRNQFKAKLWTGCRLNTTRTAHKFIRIGLIGNFYSCCSHAEAFININFFRSFIFIHKREYIEVITASIKRITDFLNSFGKFSDLIIL